MWNGGTYTHKLMASLATGITWTAIGNCFAICVKICARLFELKKKKTERVIANLHTCHCNSVNKLYLVSAIHACTRD